MTLLDTLAASLAPHCAAAGCPIHFRSPRLWGPQLRARALNALGGRLVCPNGHRARYGVVCALHVGCATSRSNAAWQASLQEHSELLAVDASARAYDDYLCDAPRATVGPQPVAERPA